MATEELQHEWDTSELAHIALDDLDTTVESVLGAARDHLGIDVAFVSELINGRQIYRSVDGDGESFGMEIGGSSAIDDDDLRALESRLPNAISDALSDAGVVDLGVAREAHSGSYVAVPLRFSDGRRYGTLCCLSHSADPMLGDQHARSLRLLAHLIADQLERRQQESESWRSKIMSTGAQALLAALEARDGYTKEHSEAVVELSALTAERLGLSARAVDEIKQVALLHDLGKIAVPDPILDKPGALEEREWVQIREHSIVGARIVSAVESLAHLAPAIRAGHERWDGRGYPDGLAGADIPLASRVVFLCDAYHAMVSDRPYRAALRHESAIRELGRGSGTQFCPSCVESLIDAC
ncbi:MAG: HD domain-containing phosphohydrolase [Actinomycetota bacterium]